MGSVSYEFVWHLGEVGSNLVPYPPPWRFKIKNEYVGVGKKIVHPWVPDCDIMYMVTLAPAYYYEEYGTSFSVSSSDNIPNHRA